MKQIFIDIFLGMVPEVLFFTFFIVVAKNLDNRKNRVLKLLVGVAINYIITGIMTTYNIYSYILIIFFNYIILNLIYRKETDKLDLFLIGLAEWYLLIVGFICFKFISNNMDYYYYALFANRILLVLPFIFKKQMNNLYNKYRLYWNRNDSIEKPIKSITLRNISLILMNVLIFILNICIININSV